MRLLLSFIALVNLFTTGFAQYKTEYGDDISPRDTIFSLNLFINIVYDLCDTCDPCTGPTPNWPVGDTSVLNDNPPVYLAAFIDRDFNADEIKGSFTRRYAEASFNNFIILGDFINLNLPQSKITPVYTGNGFSQSKLVNAAIELINEKGGLRTHFGHDSIQHYDGFLNNGERFMFKFPGIPNNKIDLLQIFVRNSTHHFGRLQAGGNAGVSIRNGLIINGIPYKYDKSTIQGAIKNMDLSYPESQPTEVHEMAHHIIGMSNSAHMGGGAPLNVGNLVTLEHNTGGWSLIGSANSSLISCNGFERWRLNWRGPDNHKYRIACKGQNSDVVQAISNHQVFYLRDFVTTGDAIRIRLPYIDSGALSQYIWLENHQIHRNGRMDYPRFWERECRTDGTPGIYVYYQVGKDSIAGNTINSGKGNGDMMPFLTDHLVPVSAEGNWDIIITDESELMCINGHQKPVQEYYRENPLSGYNDLTTHFFDPGDINTLNWKLHSTELMTKKRDGILHDSLSSSGDAFDAFTNNTSIGIGTNPAPSSLVTYHHNSFKSGLIVKRTTFPDNRKIHLSGLKLSFTKQKNGVMKVDIGWDYYDIDNSVFWTGDIVLHEKLNLLPGNKITFDQNLTPNTHLRDTITGLFAGPTYFTCLEHSEFIMQPKSEVELKNLSSFILEKGSSMELRDNSIFTVREGCTFVVRKGAELLVRDGGRIEIEENAYFCVEPGANIILQDSQSMINLHQGYNPGVNTNVLNDYGCTGNPGSYIHDGKGEINNLQVDVLQNK